MTGGEVPLRTAHIYLEELTQNEIDTLVLGCTHYPLLSDVIQQAAGAGVTLVDSADSTAQAVAEVLLAAGLSKESSENPWHRFLCTDSPDGFLRVGEQFLGQTIRTAEWVDL